MTLCLVYRGYFLLIAVFLCDNICKFMYIMITIEIWEEGGFLLIEVFYITIYVSSMYIIIIEIWEEGGYEIQYETLSSHFSEYTSMPKKWELSSHLSQLPCLNTINISPFF